MIPLTARDLQEAYLLDHKGKQWDDVYLLTKITYAKITQALNVKLGQTEATTIEYLFVFEDSVTEASNIDGIDLLLNLNVEPGYKFELVLIRAGREVGHGYYQMLQDRSIWEEGWIGEAEGLAKQFVVERAKK